MSFISETDTEVLAHLLDYYYHGKPFAGDYKSNASSRRILCTWDHFSGSSG